MEQPDGVRVGRRREQLGRRRRLDDEPGVHDVDPLGHPSDDPQVVGDEDQRRPGVRRQAPEELEDLGLDRHVEGGRRLVGDHQLRLEGEGHRDHHPLAHAAGKLVGKAVEAGLGLRDADHPEQLDRPLASLLGRRLAMGLDRLDHLLADRQDRVEAGHRVLEDHRDLLAPQLPHVALRQGHEIQPVERDGAALDVPRGLWQQPHERQIGHALAAARLADETERLAGLEVERHPVDGEDRAFMGPEADDQVPDLEKRHRQRRSRGSSDSRSPSPTRLKPMALMTIARPGK